MLSTFDALVNTPSEFVVMPALGVGVWIPHLILALIGDKRRRVPPGVTATLGSSSFILGMGVFDFILKTVPKNLRITLSWTPAYVQLAIYLVLSLTVVYFVMRFYPQGIRRLGNHGMNAEPPG